MKNIAPLLEKVAKASTPRLLCNGFACWLVHAQPLPENFRQSLADMGGWSLAEESSQSLWFFPSTDVVLGLARLHNWARLHPMPTSITVFEASLIVGEDLGQSLKVKAEFQNLAQNFSRKLTVRVSVRTRELARDMAGIAFKQAQNLDGLVGEWFDLEGNEQIGVFYRQAWLWLIRPLGARQDKTFTKGWRAYLERLEGLLRQNSIPFLQGEDQTLILKITSARSLAKLVDEIMGLLADHDNRTWPCQYMILEMGDNVFASDLPGKVRLLLEPLEANTLYLPLVTIYQLADPRMQPVDSRISVGSAKLSDLFQVHFHFGGNKRKRGSIPILLPSTLISGAESPCFYCGLRSHPSSRCPSRSLLPGNVQVSDLTRFAHLSMDALPGIMESLEKTLAPDVTRGLHALLQEKNDQSLVLGAMFEIKMICQLRMMVLVWRAKGKEWPRGIESLHAQGDPLLFESLEHLRTGNPDRAQDKLERLVLKSSRNFQPRVLLGFLALEREEPKRALALWEEGERLVYTSLQRSYLRLLQGRLREISGQLPEAMQMYSRAFAESAGLFQARYRQASCLIKSGYANEALTLFRSLISDNPDIFNAVLLDPELEGGRSHLQSELWEIWEETKAHSKEVMGSSERLPDLLAKWLPEEHDSYRVFHSRIDTLNKYAEVNNFASQVRLLAGVVALRRDIHARVKKDIQELAERRRAILDRLQAIQRESSWFPFPSMLTSFNALFSSCEEQLRQIDGLDMHTPSTFRQGHEAMREAEATLKTLEKKLLLLCGLRNSALYLLLSGKYLLIFELVALTLSGLVALGLHYLFPGTTIMGRSVTKDRWVILNVCLIFFSVLGLIATVIKASTRFEVFKNDILSKKSK